MEAINIKTEASNKKPYSKLVDLILDIEMCILLVFRNLALCDCGRKRGRNEYTSNVVCITFLTAPSIIPFLNL